MGLLLLSLLLSPLFLSSARPSVLYVSSVGGNDANAGTSPDAPLATLAATVNRLSAVKPSKVFVAGRLQLSQTVALWPTAAVALSAMLGLLFALTDMHVVCRPWAVCI